MIRQRRWLLALFLAGSTLFALAGARDHWAALSSTAPSGHVAGEGPSWPPLIPAP